MHRAPPTAPPPTAPSPAQPPAPDPPRHTLPVSSHSGRFRGRLPVPALRRPARSHCRARRRNAEGRPLPDPPGHHRVGEDGHDRLDDRAGPAPNSHHRAEQVPGRPALLGAAGPLPQEPGRVLRLVLRLLPARGLPPDDGHLHREGLVHQRRDRPPAPRHHLVAPHAAGRDRGGLGLVHLRLGLARGVPGPHPRRSPSASSTTSATSCASWSICSTPATTSTWSGARSGPAATRSRSTRPTRSRRCGSRCSATPSSASCPSTS